MGRALLSQLLTLDRLTPTSMPHWCHTGYPKARRDRRSVASQAPRPAAEDPPPAPPPRRRRSAPPAAAAAASAPASAFLPAPGPGRGCSVPVTAYRGHINITVNVLAKGHGVLPARGHAARLLRVDLIEEACRLPVSGWLEFGDFRCPHPCLNPTPYQYASRMPGRGAWPDRQTLCRLSLRSRQGRWRTPSLPGSRQCRRCWERRCRRCR